jgi:hypothetical protein
VDHDHTITMSGKSANSGIESKDFMYNTASRLLQFNATGSLNYSGVKSDDSSYVTIYIFF